MLIYIVEDDPLKAEGICSFMSIIDSVAVVRVFRSYHSGLSAITDAKPDLIILDMTLPTYDRSPAKRAGRLRPLGGYELLRKVRLHEISVRAIVVTMLESFGEGDKEISYDDMTDACEREFDEMFLGSVYFQPGTSNWQVELRSIYDRFKSELQ
ncbi:response regulator [Xanthomonas campestris]|uniref:response regulator n=1 Tax=Xanthomonas campestris TaxID=339 RepID=UPI002366C5FF|nr:response regulator [Xanthomonas campestris]WDJ04497.1 response regulator [Xanthomonas campestris pv. incanae]